MPHWSTGGRASESFFLVTTSSYAGYTASLEQLVHKINCNKVRENATPAPFDNSLFIYRPPPLPLVHYQFTRVENSTWSERGVITTNPRDNERWPWQIHGSRGWCHQSKALQQCHLSPPSWHPSGAGIYIHSFQCVPIVPFAHCMRCSHSCD